MDQAMLQIQTREILDLNHLHRNTDEEEKIELEQTDDNLVPSVHCYRGCIRSHRNRQNGDGLPFMAGFAPTMWKMAQLWDDDLKRASPRRKLCREHTRILQIAPWSTIKDLARRHQ